MSNRSFAAAALSIALVLGVAIGYVDSRPTWDDAGVTAGVTFLSSAVLSALAPRLALPIALAIGLPIVAFSVALSSNYGSAAAVVIALVGAGAGFAVRRFMLPSAPAR